MFTAKSFLVMGWYFGVLMNEEMHSKALEQTSIHALNYIIFKAKTSGITIKEV
jgi:hypothetical protein